MIITIVHASPRITGASSSIALDIVSRFEGAQVFEIHLQKEDIPYCTGCLNCISKGMEDCPHRDIILPLRDNILKADLVIVATPVYILHMSGQLKTFIDHFASLFLFHRPEITMFKKQLIVVATAAGPVYSKTLKEVAECFTNFGIPKVYKMGYAVQANSWSSVSQEKKLRINKDIDKVVKKINKLDKSKKYHTPLKSKFNFAIYRKVQFKVAGEVDRAYWEKQGWFEKQRPWKN